MLILQKMKTQNRNLLFLLMFLMTLSLLSCKSGQSNTESRAVEEAKTDDYALLRNPGIIHQRMSEDLSGKVIVLTVTEFEERITDINNPKGFQYKGQTPCVVLLHTFTSAHSTAQSDIFNFMASEFQGRVIFYKVELDKARELTTAFKVKKTPVILYFKPHNSITTTVGILNPEELKNKIDKYLLNP
jgi:hypothetical protein